MHNKENINLILLILFFYLILEVVKVINVDFLVLVSPVMIYLVAHLVASHFAISFHYVSQWYLGLPLPLDSLLLFVLKYVILLFFCSCILCFDLFCISTKIIIIFNFIKFILMHWLWKFFSREFTIYHFIYCFLHYT